MMQKRSPFALDRTVGAAPRGPGIYKLVNLQSGKCYIGQAANLRRRLSSHLRHLTKRSHPQPILHSAFAKYGREFWEFKVIEQCARTMLTEREAFHVAMTGALRSGYNCAPIRAGIEPSPAFSLIARNVAQNYHNGITDQKRSEIAQRAALTRQIRAAAARRSEIARKAAATRAANRLSKA